jgi:hypothetical protein
MCNYYAVGKLEKAMEGLREAAREFSSSETQDFKTRKTIELILKTERRVAKLQKLVRNL